MPPPPSEYDPSLASLFAQSLGPVKPLAKRGSRIESTKALDLEFTRTRSNGDISEDTHFDSSSVEESILSLPASSSPLVTEHFAKPSHKRKRGKEEDDVEGRYMGQLAREELNEHEGGVRRTRPGLQKLPPGARRTDGSILPEAEEDSESGGHGGISEGVPQHESVTNSKEELDIEKSVRTVFLANVSTLAIKSKSAKKTLLDHLTSSAAQLPTQDGRNGIESLRFRSTAFTSTGLPRKAAYAKKELMDTTTRSTNAYVVYTTQMAAREAARKLNGTLVLDRHLRVDSIAHPAKIDHRRCVFVGNLGFVDDATNMNAVEDEEENKRRRKSKEPADVEEGLWRQFGKAGTVESVRVVRDKMTRVGKGFAYVQFENPNAVEKALLYDAKKYPPMLPRTLRVSRAKSVKKSPAGSQKGKAHHRIEDSGAKQSPKLPSHVQSLSGRASKIFGRAGAAKMKFAGENQARSIKGVAEGPQSIVFEGYRATSKQGKGFLKLDGSAHKHGKPSKRSKDFKAKGRKR